MDWEYDFCFIFPNSFSSQSNVFLSLAEPERYFRQWQKWYPQLLFIKLAKLWNFLKPSKTATLLLLAVATTLSIL
jgi:hypothetical protein